MISSTHFDTVSPPKGEKSFDKIRMRAVPAPTSERVGTAQNAPARGRRPADRKAFRGLCPPPPPNEPVPPNTLPPVAAGPPTEKPFAGSAHPHLRTCWYRPKRSRPWPQVRERKSFLRAVPASHLRTRWYRPKRRRPWPQARFFRLFASAVRGLLADETPAASPSAVKRRAFGAPLVRRSRARSPSSG